MNFRNALVAGATALMATFAGAVGAQANVIYQSIPDLTVNPVVNAWCSQCQSDGQNIGQFFTLGSSAVANTLTFAADSAYVWPTAVTVDIFQDGGGNTLGANVYHQTFSSFASDTPTGFGTDVVSVNLGSVALGAGSYDLFLSNPADFGFPGFGGGPGNQIAEHVGAGSGPASGDGYYFIGGVDGGIQLAGAAGVPEPATWGMMLLGLGGLGAMMRSRRRGAALA